MAAPAAPGRRRAWGNGNGNPGSRVGAAPPRNLLARGGGAGIRCGLAGLRFALAGPVQGPASAKRKRSGGQCMLRILGSPGRLGDGWTRRDLLWAGGLGLLGLGLNGPAPRAAARTPGTGPAPAAGFGRARSCILLYLYGAASQLETFDMKPDAPENIRGELRPIRSRLPGLDVCELLPTL